MRRPQSHLDPRTRARLVAQRVIDDYGIDRPESIDLELLAAGENLYLRAGPLEGADARLVRSKRHGVATVRESIPYEGQRRFAGAHELGHWLLHPNLDQTHVDTPEQLRDYKKSQVELEANTFAAELLMPRKLFVAMLPSGPASLEQLLEAAKVFRVGPIAASNQYLWTVGRQTLLVVHKDGLVCWFLNSQDGVMSPIWPGNPVPSGVVEGLAPMLPRSRTVPAASWYGDSAAGDLTEQTLITDDGLALSLLSLV